MSTRFPIARWMIRINLWCGLASGFALLAMMLMGALDVIGTNLDLAGLTARPIPAAFEFMATMMVVNVFLAMSLGQARRRHIRVEIVLNVLPGGLRRAVEAFSLLCSIALFALIAWFGWKSGLHATGVGEYSSGLINYPVWPARLVLAVGATLMTVQCAFDFAGLFVERLRTDSASAEPDPEPNR